MSRKKRIASLIVSVAVLLLALSVTSCLGPGVGVYEAPLYKEKISAVLPEGKEYFIYIEASGPGSGSAAGGGQAASYYPNVGKIVAIYDETGKTIPNTITLGNLYAYFESRSGITVGGITVGSFELEGNGVRRIEVHVNMNAYRQFASSYNRQKPSLPGSPPAPNQPNKLVFREAEAVMASRVSIHMIPIAVILVFFAIPAIAYFRYRRTRHRKERAMVICPNCGQKTSGDYCQWCKYPILSGSPISSPKAEKQVEAQREPEPAYRTQPATKLAQRTRMGVFDRLEEKRRDKTRDNACNYLRAIGLDAHMAERGLPEECFGWGVGRQALGLIEIQGQPIRWVNVVKTDWSTGQGYSHTIYRSIYLVPALSVPTKGYLKAESVRLKSVPLIGRVVGVRWKGQLPGDLIRRMTEDVLLNQSLIELKKDIIIRSHPEQECWSIQTKKPTLVEDWHCFNTIAHHLLESSGE